MHGTGKASLLIVLIIIIHGSSLIFSVYAVPVIMYTATQIVQCTRPLSAGVRLSDQTVCKLSNKFNLTNNVLILNQIM